MGPAADSQTKDEEKDFSHQTPSSSPEKHLSENTEMKHTRFFVEDILRPEFGKSCFPTKSATETQSDQSSNSDLKNSREKEPNLWPAWVYCTRYSDRPSSGPRTRKTRKKDRSADQKRPRTAFTTEQLERLKEEFEETHYLSEEKRRALARQLNLNEAQIKIWFQNKRAKLKKGTSNLNPLAQQLMEEGLYNHTAHDER